MTMPHMCDDLGISVISLLKSRTQLSGLCALVHLMSLVYGALTAILPQVKCPLAFIPEVACF
jgi:hypothetical protein